MNLTEWKQLMNLSGNAINHDDIPNEIDVVPVIRCKDCTYYRGDHEYCVNDMFAIESGFCVWAERKEE